MRKILAILLMLTMCMVANSAYAAESVPVYVDSSMLAEAEFNAGRVFLPMRVIFEACGAEVTWEGDTKHIYATGKDGRRVDMWVGNKEILLLHDGAEPEKRELENAPYIMGGKTYVPVRVVSEAMGCSVAWLTERGCVEITSAVLKGVNGVNLDIAVASGEILSGSDVLGQVDLQVQDNFSAEGYKTDGGNYVIVLQDWESGAITVNNYRYIWLNPQTGEAVAVTEKPYLSERVGVLSFGTKICLPGDDVAYVIDDKTGSVAKYDLKALSGHSANDDGFGFCAVWFDDDVMLVRNFDATYWGLLDFANGTMRDITADILSDEVKDRVNAKLWPLVKDFPVKEDYADDEEYLAEFIWGTLRQSATILDPHLSLEFVGVEDDELKFEVTIWGDNFVREDTVEIACKLK